ncbi:glycosyltransferase [Actinomadura madurae]|uniref:Glycosyltransferase involved in cell wall bisynthesis n=1 Tax=Actinomadura madurae TaxID=1993 RepID=A0A1I5UD84_9ACTN|nr:glycosyltransferase [Actinomadura madurae]SFP92606.1 Glycosyltransferase involved in cell wall bisynthesis [Actinomadura madurae]SPT51926.1 GDP-mannose-dependent alpha-mannosyltransferase [Actinomadura madurae]
MTRVLHVITGLEHGGAERQLVLLLRHLPVACEVATLTRTGTLGAEIRRSGVPVHEIGMRGNRDLAALPRLARLIRRGRYDVVHTHLYRACVYGRIAARMAGVPRVIATEHSLGDGHIEGRPTTRGVRALYRATERLGSATVAVSPAVAARLRGWGVPPGRIAVIPNGIDAAAFAFDAARRAATRRRLGIGPAEPVVGALGRLVPTKRFDLLIEAVARLGGVRLLLVGAGPERVALERLARDPRVAGRVIFAGGTSDVAGALAAMDVLAAPSVQETFGLGVLEALAAGLPVRYTVCPALDGLPPGAAPQARRLPTDAGIWSAELARVLRAPRDRTRVPPAVARYAIAERAAELARLYRPEPPVRGAAPIRERVRDAAT